MDELEVQNLEGYMADDPLKWLNTRKDTNAMGIKWALKC